jgi:hypothetical protein
MRRAQRSLRKAARASAKDGVLLPGYQGVRRKVGLVPWVLMYQYQTAA